MSRARAEPATDNPVCPPALRPGRAVIGRRGRCVDGWRFVDGSVAMGAGTRATLPNPFNEET